MKRLSIERKEEIHGYLYLLPVFVVFALIIFIPAAKAVIDSFTNSSLYQKSPSFIGLANYVHFFGDREFWGITLRTVWMVAVVIALQYLLGVVLALLLNMELPGLRWVKNFIMLPWVVPIAAMAVMFNWMSQTDYGLFNIILKGIGLGGVTRYWLGDKHFAFPMVVLMHVWRNTPFYAITLYAALKTIPHSMYEASSIDGATRVTQFFKITLPYIRYPSMIVITLHVLFTINNFDIVYLTTGGGPVGKTEVLATQVYQIAWTNYEYGSASALGVLMLLLMMVFTIVYMRLVRGR